MSSVGIPFVGGDIVFHLASSLVSLGSTNACRTLVCCYLRDLDRFRSSLYMDDPLLRLGDLDKDGELSGDEWTGWAALLLHPLLALPFFALAWLAGRLPRLSRGVPLE